MKNKIIGIIGVVAIIGITGCAWIKSIIKPNPVTGNCALATNQVQNAVFLASLVAIQTDGAKNAEPILNQISDDISSSITGNQFNPVALEAKIASLGGSKYSLIFSSVIGLFNLAYGNQVTSNIDQDTCLLGDLTAVSLGINQAELNATASASAKLATLHR